MNNSQNTIYFLLYIYIYSLNLGDNDHNIKFIKSENINVMT